jgi:hypothetical protein
VLADRELLTLATEGTAKATRLVAGAFTVGAPADFVAIDSLERFLAGERSAIALVLAAGRALYGSPSLLGSFGGFASLTVDGLPRGIEPELGRRLAAARKRHPALDRAPWLARVQGLSAGDDRKRLDSSSSPRL